MQTIIADRTRSKVKKALEASRAAEDSTMKEYRACDASGIPCTFDALRARIAAFEATRPTASIYDYCFHCKSRQPSSDAVFLFSVNGGYDRSHAIKHCNTCGKSNHY